MESASKRGSVCAGAGKQLATVPGARQVQGPGRGLFVGHRSRTRVLPLTQPPWRTAGSSGASRGRLSTGRPLERRTPGTHRPSTHSAPPRLQLCGAPKQLERAARESRRDGRGARERAREPPPPSSFPAPPPSSFPAPAALPPRGGGSAGAMRLRRACQSCASRQTAGEKRRHRAPVCPWHGAAERQPPRRGCLQARQSTQHGGRRHRCWQGRAVVSTGAGFPGLPVCRWHKRQG